MKEIERRSGGRERRKEEGIEGRKETYIVKTKVGKLLFIIFHIYKHTWI